jgi:hypothetical protein
MAANAAFAAVAGIGISSILDDAKELQIGTDPATPNVLSSTPVPAEVSRHAGDWPVVQGDLQATRVANNSSARSRVGLAATPMPSSTV